MSWICMLWIWNSQWLEIIILWSPEKGASWKFWNMDLGWPITPVQKRSVATPFDFWWSSKSSEKPLWQLGDFAGDPRELGQYLVRYCLSFVICMLSLSVVILFSYRYNARFFLFILHPHLHSNNVVFVSCVELWWRLVKVCIFLCTHSLAFCIT